MTPFLPSALLDKLAKTANITGNLKDVLTKAAGRIAKGVATHMCFPAGTPVHTANGLVPIENIRAGDLVLSRDERTGAQTYKPVLQTFETRPDALYTITYDRDGAGPTPATTIDTTAPHPFYVVNRDGDGRMGGFAAAIDLVIGDQLSLADGGSAWVTVVSREEAAAGETYTTYNFEVADYHTYFVNADGVWVHNQGKFTCDDFFDHVEWMRKKDGSTRWQAFDKVLRLSNPDLHQAGTPGHATAKKLAAKYDPNLATAAREVMTDAYTSATAGGNVDLSKIPTAKQLYQSLGYEYLAPVPSLPDKKFWQGRRAKDLEVHHTAAKAITRKLLIKMNPDLVHISPEAWDDI